MSNKIATEVELQSPKLERIKKLYKEKKEIESKKIVTPGIGAVLADERTNSLIIKENPEVIDRLEELIGELDKPTPYIYSGGYYRNIFDKKQ